MQKFVARLVDCGIPRKVAVCVCADFLRRGKIIELAQYVDVVEEECNGPMADV